MYIAGVFGAPLLELHEKCGVDPQLQVFPELELLELDLFGMTYWWSWLISWSGVFPNTPLEHLQQLMYYVI